jgi:hypothetical protein
MKGSRSRMIHFFEFGCQAPLRFYEHCSACPLFGDSCHDLMLGKEILRGKKKLVYDGKDHGDGSIDASSFNCSAPLDYFEMSRKSCGHEGRCREEGLLLALLSGQKQLDYSQKTAIEIPYLKKRLKEAETREPDSMIYTVR